MLKLTLAVVAAAAIMSASTTPATMQETSKKGYIIALIDVSNPQQYAKYTELTPAVVEKFGGRFVVRGGRSKALEGDAASGRVVILEFPSFDRAQAFYDSPDYQAAKKMRLGAATVRFILVEGM